MTAGARRRRRPGNSCSAPISTSRAEGGAHHALPRRMVRRRASRCCWTWRASRRPRSTSPRSWRGISSPTIRRRRRRPARPGVHSGEGDLPAVYRALVMREEPLVAATGQIQDAERLYDLDLSRHLTCPWMRARCPLVRSSLGQRVWSPNSPAGWPDRSADWDGASALMQRCAGRTRSGSASAPAATRRSWHRRLLGANLATTHAWRWAARPAPRRP